MKNENESREILSQRLARRSSVASTQEGPGKQLCSSMTKKGVPCTQRRWNSTDKCLLHQPGYAARLGQRGGRRRARFSPENLAAFKAPTSVREQAAILAQLQVETHQGLIDPKVASTISTLANAYLSALELVEFGEKLRELEARIGVRDSLDRLSRDETREVM